MPILDFSKNENLMTLQLLFTRNGGRFPGGEGRSSPLVHRKIVNEN
jgi:hypothetical protein